jgi:hypothetical protein
MKYLRDLTPDEIEVLAIYLALEYLGYAHASQVQEEGDESMGELLKEIEVSKESFKKGFVGAYDNDRGTFIIHILFSDERDIEVLGENYTVRRQNKLVDEFFIRKDGINPIKIENCVEWDLV